MMLRRLAALVALAALPSAALAHSGSAEDQLACTPDVYRLCAALIPNEDAIVACLQRNRSNLSAQCRQVFSKPDPGQHDNTNNGNDDSDDN